MPTNFAEGWRPGKDVEFHAASAAFISPALSPTRGSGLGGVADMLPAGDAPLPFIDAASARRPP